MNVKHVKMLLCNYQYYQHNYRGWWIKKSGQSNRYVCLKYINNGLEYVILNNDGTYTIKNYNWEAKYNFKHLRQIPRAISIYEKRVEKEAMRKFNGEYLLLLKYIEDNYGKNTIAEFVIQKHPTKDSILLKKKFHKIIEVEDKNKYIVGGKSFSRFNIALERSKKKWLIF